MKVNVPDISCKHCVMAIQKSLILSGLNAKVDLDDKSVSFKNDKDLDKVIDAIKKAGYTPEL
ncbi:MAG: heavy-metal-associated domain-containing protein [Acholeplasmataceae bacterium]|nr:heavy-metal-associated domain-containing protein [Acholeplasmataceae bacterium]